MIKRPETELVCPNCGARYYVSASSKKRPSYCPFCGLSVDPDKTKTLLSEPASTLGPSLASASTASATLIKGLQPAENSIQFSIGPYQILQEIGKGGMGEVFLAYDTAYGRRIALKRIRSDLLEHVQMHNRFLKEARVTSQLTHPSIIPIYAIHEQDDLVYYTMPYVEGQTLKQILRRARIREKRGKKPEASASIPALVRLFLNICQAIAYAHVNGVLHRDIKPENIIVGQFGEVMLLDWGLAKLMKFEEPNQMSDAQETSANADIHPLHQLTHLGKVVGTVAYMAPERALGSPATLQSDIYSLGVILYQILTLRPPFKRGSLKEFREILHQELLRDPIEVAPYRDIPRILSQVVLKCLSPNLEQRYCRVQDLIHDIETYLEGRSEWFQMAELDIQNKEDWEFQENVLIAEHVAVTRSPEESDWVSLMISKSSFSENIRIEAKILLGERGNGLGFLLSVPEMAERTHLNDGYCLWLGNDQNRTTKLLRSTVEVLQAPDSFLRRQKWEHVSIEKVDNRISLYLNHVLQFSYMGHLPLIGTHMGLLSRDADYMIKELHVFVGSQNVMVNCLAVPDAFLAHRDYTTALSEYRRIGYSFPGRAEGREAMFRAGITLLEQARNSKNSDQSAQLKDLALAEFEKLHHTPGAPLEYLGKALVYQELNEFNEEVKCFELAFRRYPHHPLLPILEEQIIYRMLSSSRLHRKATYKFILLVVRQIPEAVSNPNVKKLFFNLKKHWEPLPFLEDLYADESEKTFKHSFAIALAFWLAKPYALGEIVDEILKSNEPHLVDLCNAIFCLIELGAWQFAHQKIQQVFSIHPEWECLPTSRFRSLQVALACHQNSIRFAASSLFTDPVLAHFDKDFIRALIYICKQALLAGQSQIVQEVYQMTQEKAVLLSESEFIMLDSLLIWSYLLEKQWLEAGQIFHRYPLEMLNQDKSILHFLYGCWLAVTEGSEIAAIHFSGILETAYPPSYTLFSHYYNDKIHSQWFERAFIWEKRQLYMQLILFYQCTNQFEKAAEYKALEKKEYLQDKPY